ncbi:hypothetical protein SAMN04488564_12273 [Lentzea waywayandensis]|uniref:Uncharacterized protein n=1 Tax=Lentzea waywayandensis TaxID=84724 RepID=A0A1I6FJ26_9PSEU|nr:hypothetical protein SAMN04488564_12273 [Lentzea waywayandensis]
MSVSEAVTKMPYGFSLAQLRCVELAEHRLASEPS